MQKVRNENLKIVLDVVRKTTKAIKVFPFLYALLLLVLFPIVAYVDFDIATIINEIFYVSPLFIGFLILLSFYVKLCNWYRLQCLLPLLPQITNSIDTYIYEFSYDISFINLIVMLVIFILSLINAYFVFIKPTQKRFPVVYQSSQP